MSQGLTSLRPPPAAATAKSGNGPSASFQMALLNRAHQQAAVAALGQAALTGVDLLTLLEQAAVFVSQTLGLDFVGIYERAEDGTRMKLVAGFGWNSGVVGETTVETDAGSMAAYVLGSSEPVIVRDMRAITAFAVPEFMRAHGVVSSISLVIPGGPGPWGVLEVQCRRSRVFDEDDFHFLHSVANVISTADARKRAEAENQHLAAFVEHNPNPVIELDEDGRVAYCNDAARIMSGALRKYHPGELLPASVGNIVHTCLSSDERILNEQAEIDGRTLSWSFFPSAGRRRVHGYAVDVTERLNLEAQLRQSQKMEAIGQLAAGVAHDFNNILTIMQGLVHRLGLTAAQDQNEMLGQLLETTERAASLTRQLLTFSRRQVLQRKVLRLSDVVSNMSRMLQRIIGEDIALLVDHSGNVPAIEADAAMMEQIVMNLAVNARDAMPRGGQLTITTDLVEVEQEDSRESWVRLRVCDTGCGMPVAVKARIFEPFYTTKEVGKGTGLGLATVFGIVQQHAGFIDVDSAEGQGTVFTILFPPTAKPAESKPALRNEQALRRGRGQTILLVEDEPILRELAHAILKDAGYNVLDAEASHAAFEVWSEHAQKIDLLLTDMVLPGGMSGRELALELQQRKPGLKVIYCTGYSQEMLESQDEPIHFLQKPYPPETLMRAVHSCLDEAGDTAEVALA